MKHSRRDDIDLEEYFEYVEIRSRQLRDLLKKVLIMINRSTDLTEHLFGPISDRKTYSGEVAEVTEDGAINFDSVGLAKYGDDVAMAIIAHELAHHLLGHYKVERGLEAEAEADEQAKRWGFNVGKFRKVCGPPTIYSQGSNRNQI